MPEIKLVYNEFNEKPFMVLTKSLDPEEGNNFNLYGKRYNERSIRSVLYNLIIEKNATILIDSSVPSNLELIIEKLADNGQKRARAKIIYQKGGKEAKIKIIEDRITLYKYIKNLEKLRDKQAQA
ncbi:MAG: hypothetical protein KJ623_01620 [Nanoarchaeota archaeon]|nr:hypothetical protein [Nanoarchaeota archaeon]MBU0962761.1 hypothetical protein [Nanoarchaeota archaeon]